MEDIDNWSCYEYEICKKDCIRRNNYKGYMWFSGWLEGQSDPTLSCNYQKPSKVMEMFNTLFE